MNPFDVPVLDVKWKKIKIKIVISSKKRAEDIDFFDF